MRAFLLFLVSAMLAVTAASAQSLADVARKEQERRKQIANPSKVYTNKDVKPARPVADAGRAATPSAADPAAAPPAGPAGEPGAAPAAGDPAAQPAAPTEEDDRAKQEQEWRQRAAAARSDLERSRMFAEALQSRINALLTDFTARDDPAQRSLIEADRRKALAELERVNREIQEKTAAIADLEEEARRAGVPPGWLR